MTAYIRKSFKRKLLLCFLGVAILPLILTSGFLIELFKAKLERDHEKQDLQQTAVIGESLNTQLSDFAKVAEEISSDEKLISLLQQRETALQEETAGGAEAGGQEQGEFSGDFTEQNEIYALLYEATDGMRTKAQFDIYTEQGVCVCSTGAGLVHEDLPVYWGILQTATAHPEEMIIRQERDYTGNTDILLRAAKVIQDDEDNKVGYVVISMRAENFDQMLGGMHSSQDGICILNEFWEEVYSTGVAERENIAEVLKNQLFEGEEPAREYHDVNVYIAEIGETGFYTVYLRPKAFTEDTVQTMYRVMLAMTVLSMLLCVGVAIRMSSSLTKPVSSLTEAMQRVQEGRLDTRIELEREDEFGQLAKNFNIMTVELQEYMERQVGQQRELNEANIAMMQAQLNPHFLYNTLDTMKWVAKAHGIQELAMMATKLAKILRTSISKAQFITLKEEMELVESYIRIQEIRFAGKFHYEESVPEELQVCIVPKLMIQPIVENAILHGFEGRQDGHIRVQACQKEQELWIEVRDDGCGIPAEILKQLNDRKQKKQSGHIGLYNVDTIIQLNYGKEYGLRIDQPGEGGTCVVIVLPVGRGGIDTDVEGIGRG